jgi:5-methyltetrahydropteroyltriglutamate--homocysteine methyltransferase
MRRSETRILTTHAGSLPRPKTLVDLFTRASRGEGIDTAALDDQVRAATAYVVAQQLACGIDVGNDGEQPRESFFTYVRDRMSGFGGQSQRPVMRDLTRYPTFIERMMLELGRPQVSLLSAPQAVGDVRYADPAPLTRELDALTATLARHAPTFTETFWTAPSPGIVACAMQNAHYPSLEAYVDAVADALATEYETIVARGHVLQIDAPDLAMERHTLFADRPLGDFLRFVEHTVGAVNRALARIPPHRVRLHVCWGNYEGPHTDDVDLAPLLPLVYQARVGGLVLSMANPRHAHEHRVLAANPLPDDWVLVAGVIDTTTNYVEHPEVVAERLEIAARVTGDPHRVLAGTDCGFDTSAGLGQVAEEVVWEKLRALRDGAALASGRLLPS